MSKASAVIAAVAAVTIVTGAVAARLTDGFDFRARMTFSDHQQRQWRLKTSSDVKIELDDPSGVMFAQGGNEETPRASAVPYVDVQVGGFQMAIRGMGRHEIRDANGNLLGSIVLSDWNAQERTQNSADAAKAIPPHDYDAFVAWAIESEKASGGIRGVATMGPMAWGHDEASGLFWCARGLGTIAVPWTSAPTPLEPIAPEASAVYPTLKFTPEELATPRLTVIVDGKRADYQGYGAYAAPIRDGKTVKFTMEKPRG